MQTKLNRITLKAKEDRKCRFNNLVHSLNVPNLKECFYLLKKNKAAGIDGVTYGAYEKSLDENLENLTDRIKSMSYRPQPVKRVYIPKTDGRKRPLGIPAIEDKIVQMCISRMLNAIYENDFIENSYGFRPKRNCHQALYKLHQTIMYQPVNYIIDADIKGFFDNVNHKWMRKCLEERIADENLLRIILRFMKAGIIEDGKYQDTEKGTPQGGVLSPILSNIYLHYILDIWIERVVKKTFKGYVSIIRYADDFVICVEREEESGQILEALKLRLQKFGLELSEEKTKVIAFGRKAEEKAKSQGKKPDTFDFLSFTHYNTRSRAGNYKVGRKTTAKKFRQSLKEITEWVKRVRTCKNKDWWAALCSKLRGYYAYYGVSENSRMIHRYYYKVKKMLFKWLNRRSQKKSYNWKEFQEYLDRYRLPKPRIIHSFYEKSV